jgi:hypothetical protein
MLVNKGLASECSLENKPDSKPMVAAPKKSPYQTNPVTNGVTDYLIIT